MAVGLFDPARVQRVQSRQFEIERRARLQQRVKHAARELRRNVKLPTEFADIGDPRGANLGIADRYFAPGAKGMRRIRKVRTGKAFQQCAAVRPHHGEDSFGGGDIGDKDVRRPGEMALRPGEIPPRRGSRGNDNEACLRQPRDRKISLYAAALVQPLRVNNTARTDADLVGADPLQRRLRPATLNQKLAE